MGGVSSIQLALLCCSKKASRTVRLIAARKCFSRTISLGGERGINQRGASPPPVPHPTYPRLFTMKRLYSILAVFPANPSRRIEFTTKESTATPCLYFCQSGECPIAGDGVTLRRRVSQRRATLTIVPTSSMEHTLYCTARTSGSQTVQTSFHRSSLAGSRGLRSASEHNSPSSSRPRPVTVAADPRGSRVILQ